MLFQKTKIVSLLFIFILVFSLNIFAQDNQIEVYDDFESYNTGELTTTNWDIITEGTDTSVTIEGNSNQYVKLQTSGTDNLL